MKYSIKSFLVATALATSSILAREGDELKGFSLSSEDSLVIQKVRQFFNEHAEKSTGSELVAQSQEILNPYVKKLLEMMEKGKNLNGLEFLKEETKGVLKEKSASPEWLLDMTFRYLALEGVSDEELDIFRHVGNGEYLEVLLAKTIKGEPVVLKSINWEKALRNSNTSSFTNYPIINPYLSLEARRYIERLLLKELNIPIVFPCFGQDVLPIPTINKGWFDRICYFGVPTSEVPNVHGIYNVTKLGFAYHDLFHYKNDTRLKELFDFITRSVKDNILEKPNQSINEEIDKVVPGAIDRYKQIITTLQIAYERIKQDRKADLGFFMLTHEVYGFSKSLFKGEISIEFIIDKLVDKGILYYSLQEVWENPEDPLMTNLKGNTSLSDKEIIDIAIDKLATDVEFILPYQVTSKYDDKGNYLVSVIGDEAIKLRKQWLLDFTQKQVVKSAQFIDVIVELPSMQKKRITFPTMKRKWDNVRSSMNLLSYAEINLQKPELKEDDREKAINFLTQIRDKFVEVLEYFRTEAKGGLS